MKRLDPSVSAAVWLFSFWLANRTVGLPLLDGIDYSAIFSEPSALEKTYAIFINCLELDDSGQVINAKQAERRAAQFVRSYVSSYTPDPALEDWETALY